MSKKITTGVEKAYYAILTEEGETPTYEAAKYLPGLREISVTPNEEQATIYAENRLYDSENSLGEIEVTLDFASIDTTDYVALLGKKVATDGGIIESVDDQSPYIALMVEKTLSGGVKEYLTLFKGKLSIPEDKAKTKEGKTEYQTSSLSAIFMPLENGIWKHAVKTTDEGFNAETHATKWGKAVTMPTVKVAVEE
ncbi:major tail protein [Clostridium tertium]